MNKKIFVSALALCVCAFVFVGCDKGPKKVAVSGTITVDGETIDTGAVKFDATDGQGMSDGCAIKDGKFECEMTTGEKKVTVTAASKIVGQYAPDPLYPDRMSDKTESMDLSVFKQEKTITVEKKGQTFDIDYSSEAE